MLSRSALLLRREYRQHQLLPFPNVAAVEPYAVLVERVDNAEYWLDWKIKLTPTLGAYEGCQLHLELLFSPKHDHDAPAVNCLTVIYHPNVNAETGKLLTPSLINWRPGTSIRQLLKDVMEVLESPSSHLDCVLNEEAASNPTLFHNRAAACRRRLSALAESSSDIISPNAELIQSEREVEDAEQDKAEQEEQDDKEGDDYDPFQAAYEKLCKAPVIPRAQQLQQQAEAAKAAPFVPPSLDYADYKNTWNLTATTRLELPALTKTRPRIKPLVTYDAPSKPLPSYGTENLLHAGDKTLENTEPIATLPSLLNIVAPPTSAGSLTFVDGDDILAWSEQLIHQHDDDLF